MAKGSLSRGFTLSELLVTIAVMGILAGVMTPKIRGYVAHAKCSGATASINSWVKYKNQSGGMSELSLTDGMTFPSDGYFDFSLVDNNKKSNKGGNSNGNKNSLSGGNGVGKSVVCHVPNGDYSKAFEIEIGNPSYQTHLDHGDPVGPCPKDNVLFVTATENIAPDCHAGDGLKIMWTQDSLSVEPIGDGNCQQYMTGLRYAGIEF